MILHLRTAYRSCFCNSIQRDTWQSMQLLKAGLLYFLSLKLLFSREFSKNYCVNKHTVDVLFVCLFVSHILLTPYRLFLKDEFKLFIKHFNRIKDFRMIFSSFNPL